MRQTDHAYNSSAEPSLTEHPHPLTPAGYEEQNTLILFIHVPDILGFNFSYFFSPTK
jgi:hypothetical protein